MPGHTSSIAFTFDYWQGLVAGLLCCDTCGHYGLARLLDWRGGQLEQRIFSIANLKREPTSVFLRNMNSDYCDLSRKTAEWNALIATSPARLLGLFQLPEMRCLASRNLIESPGYPDWRQLAVDAPNSPWWTKFTDLKA